MSSINLIWVFLECGGKSQRTHSLLLILALLNVNVSVSACLSATGSGHVRGVPHPKLLLTRMQWKIDGRTSWFLSPLKGCK